jgi:hypothetical protein
MMPVRHPSSVHWRRIAVAASAAVLVAFVAVCLVIGRQVDAAVTRAQKAHPVDGVSALILVVESRDTPVPERNRAIWALGQLGARAALPVLRSLSGSDECSHGTAVCQREVRKAIALCEGRFNVGALVWRHGRLAVGARG